jgi:cell division septation protein DedD
MADEEFHEIQLNGKQLVFLFMAATSVAVVIFLCGVMVGRGVRVERARELAELAAETAADPTARVESSADVGDPSTVPTSPSGTEEELSYPERLAEPSSPPETLTEPAPPPSTAAESQRAPRRASQALLPLAADGFTVQVAAVKARREADTIAGRLTKKGYAAYVMAPAAGAPTVFRVRVGKYKERRDAESVATRLEREEQFKPWITR